MKNTKGTEIKKQMSKLGQTAEYEEVLKDGFYKLWIRIVSDSCRSQCSARISIWSEKELKWNTVHSIHKSLMKTADGLAYSKSPIDNSFDEDRNELLVVARGILG